MRRASFLATGAGLDPEVALLGCHFDRYDNPNNKAMWESIAKKFNGRGLQGISMVCGGLAMWIGSPSEAISQCALCVLMLSAIGITANDRFINSLAFERVNHEVSRND